MIVIIDNTAENEVVFYVQKNKNWLIKKCVNHHKSLLERLALFLSKNNYRIQDISGLAVLVGRGRFTATRIAVTMANSLAYALSVPIISYVNHNTQIDFDQITELLRKTKKKVYISAKYSAPVHIGGKIK